MLPLSLFATTLTAEDEVCTGVRGAASTADGTLLVGAHNFCAVGPIEPWNLVELDPQTGETIGTAATEGRSALPIFGILGPALVSGSATVPPAATLDIERPVLGDSPMTIDVTYAKTWCFDRPETTVADGQVDILAREICGCDGGPTPGIFQVEVGPLPIGPYQVHLSRQGFDGDGLACDERRRIASASAHVSTRSAVFTVVPEPIAPTSEDDVTLVVSTLCPTEVALESVVDGIVWLASTIDPGAPSQPCGVDHRFPLGTLPARSHTVVVRQGPGADPAFLGLARFDVRDAGSPAVTVAGRFRVEATWTRFDGTGDVARGRLIDSSDIGAELWFANPANPELLVKLLDGCNNNGHHWFFAAGLTNLGVALTVTDLETGEERIYDNPVGQDFAPILDTHAFDCP